MLRIALTRILLYSCSSYTSLVIRGNIFVFLLYSCYSENFVLKSYNCCTWFGCVLVPFVCYSLFLGNSRQPLLRIVVRYSCGNRITVFILVNPCVVFVLPSYTSCASLHSLKFVEKNEIFAESFPVAQASANFVLYVNQAYLM